MNNVSISGAVPSTAAVRPAVGSLSNPIPDSTWASRWSRLILGGASPA